MLYKYEGREIELISKYLYELDVYYISYDRAELVSSKFISSDKEIKVKKPISIENHKIKKSKDGYIIEKSFNLIGAPQTFMNRNGLKPIQ